MQENYICKRIMFVGQSLVVKIGMLCLLCMINIKDVSSLDRIGKSEGLRQTETLVKSKSSSELYVKSSASSTQDKFQGKRKLLRNISNPIEDKKKAFICITGQLSRLELENKIRNILEPLHQQGYELSVALVLSKGEPKFTNKSADESRYDSLRDAFEVLDNLQYVRILNPSRSAYKPLAHPNPPAVYYMSLKKVDKRSFEEVLERSENHMRIFDSYQRCWDIERTDAFDAFHGASPPPAHDVYIRIREDVGLTQPVNMTLVNDLVNYSHTAQNPKIMLVTDCRSWGGINDRMAIVSSAAAQDYFLSPYTVLAGDPFRGFGDNGLNKIDWSNIITPESLLKQTYDASGIHIVQSKYLRSVKRIIVKKKQGDVVIDGYHGGDNKEFCPDENQ